MLERFYLTNTYKYKKDLMARVKFADGLLVWLSSLGVRPNHITVVSILFGLLSTFFLFREHTLFILTFLAHILLDGFDGFFARTQGLESRFGDYLDHGGDVIIGLALLIKGLIVFGSIWFFLGVFVYIGEFLILYELNYLRDKFPSRGFAFIFFFKIYEGAVLMQVVYSVVTLAIFLVGKMKTGAKPK